MLKLYSILNYTCKCSILTVLKVIRKMKFLFYFVVIKIIILHHTPNEILVLPTFVYLLDVNYIVPFPLKLFG